MSFDRSRRPKNRRRPSVPSNNSVFQVQRKLGKVFLLDREPLRRRLDQLNQEFEKLAQKKAKEIEEKRDSEVSQVESSSTDKQERDSHILARVADDPDFQDWERRLQALSMDCDISIEKVERRRASTPRITYPADLPVVERKDELKQLIRDNQVIVVCGETGSGKSTQLPKICLELGLGARGMIGHTQPRRIAARSIAQRVADELRSPLGQAVGYKIRFADAVSDGTLVKLMTDGILLAESQTDRFFNRYEVIIVDEAHERSLNVDFLLGMLKRVLQRRRDLKLIVTSATIDAERFARHFATAEGPAPIVEVSGRTYPIEILYRPVDELKKRREEAYELGLLRRPNNSARDADEEDAADATLLDAIDELARKGRGDILVFMPTERDIFETAKLLKGRSIPGDDPAHKTQILPLYARLPSEEQQKIFGASPNRKIVIATNVAESSLTVPGIRYVVDTGTARISRYSARSKTQRLPIEPISQASADQRAGRCGRVGPGVCIRTYSKRDYESRPKYTTPEIQRTNLASVILQTKALRLGDVSNFPFIDPPSRASVDDGFKTLFELGAVDDKLNLTEIGKTLSKLPLDPRIARMLLAANEERALNETLVIASALEILDPRERPQEKKEAADLKHAPFLDEESDFMSYLKLWDFWQGLKEKLSKSQLRKACRENFLSYNRMREWSDVYVQLRQMVHELKFVIGPRRNDYASIHRSILTGLLYAVAHKSETGTEYSSTNSGKFIVWPGSGLKKKPTWIVGAERVETSNKFLRTVAKIDPNWIEELGEKLIVKTRRDPFWNRETGYVHAYERASLYGLTIVPRRRVNYGPLDPVKAREIFISDALVNRNFDCSLPFFENNVNVYKDAEKLRDRLRKYDFVRSFDAIYDFYDKRLPADVYDSVTLKQWHKKASSDERRALFATLPDFCFAEEVDENALESFPDELTLGGASQYPLEYAFNPGGEDDGVSVVAPLEGLRQLDARRLGWLVPGLLEQKVVALLKTLPKEIRRELVPVPDTAREIVKKLQYGQGSLEEVLALEVTRRVGRKVNADSFDLERIPLELQLNVKVVDESGALLAESRDAEELRERLGVEMNRSIGATNDPKWNRDGLVAWDFGSLPDSITLRRGDLNVLAYPALCDPRFLSSDFNPSGDLDRTVALRLFDSRDKAMRQTYLGVLRLFNIANKRDLRSQTRWIPNIEKMRAFSRSIKEFDVDQAIAETIGARALDLDIVSLPVDEGDYNRLATKGRARIGGAVQELTGWFGKFTENYQEARLAIEKRRGGPLDYVVKDAQRQIDRLLEPRFYLTTPWQWLKEYPRYFKAIVMRFEKWTNGGAKNDAIFTKELDEFWARYEDAAARAENAGIIVPELETFRWAIEEYRVSLFAQKLGAAMKISAVRLEKLWDAIVV